MDGLDAPGVMSAAVPRPPRPLRRPFVTEIHGERLRDDYHWLRDKRNPRVLAHLEAENRHTDAVMRPTLPLQEKLYTELRSRVQETDMSVPRRRGDWLYYRRLEAGKQYPIHCRRHGSMSAPEEITLDENVLAAATPYLAVGTVRYSPDHRFVAYAVDTEGGEHYTVRVRDLTTGGELADVLTDVSVDPHSGLDIVWSADSRSLYYAVPDRTDRPYRLLRHDLGTAQRADPLLYEEKDPTFLLELAPSDTRRFLVITSESTTTTEQRLLDLTVAGSTPRLVAPRRRGVRYMVGDHPDALFVLTNDGATNYRLMTAPLTGGDPAAWRELVGERPGTTLSDVRVFRDHLVLTERRDDGLDHLVVSGLDGRGRREVGMAEPDYAVSVGDEDDFAGGTLRFVYESLVTPPTTIDLDLNDGNQTVLKRLEVPGYDPSRYEAARIYVPAADGTRIPVSLVRRRDRARTGVKPLLLYGYGAYGWSVDSDFDSDIVSLLDRGFTYAIAHVRGGGELGEPWRLGGNMLNKRNTFTDFISVAENLVASGETTRDGLMASGRSAGGLLMGAVTTMRPDLFRAVVAGVPFVDVINTMLDDTIPLTTAEYDEWGNPHDRAMFDYMRSYSPYDNVRPARYPSLLVTAGLNDPRVGFWEPAKWVARLREANTGADPILLKTNMGKGHFAFTGRFDALREQAFEQAFLLDAAGIRD